MCKEYTLYRENILKRYVLFGVGKYVSSFLHIIHFFGGEVTYLVDNDSKKIGTIYAEKEIISPTSLTEIEDKILISCVHYEAIKKQLEQLELSKRIISLYDCLQELLAVNEIKIARKAINKNSYYLDLYSGARWGGAEKWNLDLANVLYNKGFDFSIIEDDIVELDEKNRVPIIKIDEDNSLEKIIDRIKNVKNVTFINSFFGESFFAMIALKLLFPLQIRIVTVVHNDYMDLYQLCMLFNPFIDQYICVSSRIRNVLVNRYNVCENKASFLYQPIQITKYKKEFTIRKNIRIGIASRLTKHQKRCDLILLLIDFLEKSNIDYEMHVAGDGDMLSDIQQYRINQKLESKIYIYGYLNSGEMSSFWKKQDIYVNVSDFEGTSLAMLEAMSYSCVPVVTDVSGVRDYIVNGVEGYIHQCGDIQGIANSIVYLHNHRDKISLIGQAARTQIEEKCNIDKYAEKFISLIGGV